MQLFKELAIGTEFTSPDLAEGTLVKLSPKKYALAGSNSTGTVCPINTKVNKTFDPINKTFDPNKIMEEIRRKAWPNYTVTEESSVELLGNLVQNDDFIKRLAWDVRNNPIFNDNIHITFPAGVTEANYTGFMEKAIPDPYKRRVIKHRAQGLKGMDLFYALVMEIRATMPRNGSGVNRAAHLSTVKQNTRRTNRSRRTSRKYNLQHVA